MVTVSRQSNLAIFLYLLSNNNLIFLDSRCNSEASSVMISAEPSRPVVSWIRLSPPKWGYIDPREENAVAVRHAAHLPNPAPEAHCRGRSWRTIRMYDVSSVRT